MSKPYWLYVMASKRNGTLYVGTTGNLAERIAAHKQGRGAAFVRQHNVRTLVYFQRYADYESARAVEVRIKRWRRAWKLDLIEQANPQWLDLSDTLNQ